MSSLVVAVQPGHEGDVLEVSLAPYLLRRGQPLGVQSSRHVAAADTLWEILEASPFTWQRFVPLHDRLLFFYCPLVHLALEIVDEGALVADIDAPALAQLAVSVAAIPMRDLEEHPGAVATWLSALCTRRADSRPGAAPDGEMHRAVWMRLTHG